MPKWYCSKAQLVKEALPEGTQTCNFAVSEPEAWLRYPHHNWISNKMLVAQTQKLRCAPCEIWPEERDPHQAVDSLYPVIVKPMVNLFGMGVGAEKINSSADYMAHEQRSGCFWTEWLTGEFLSVDVLVHNGHPRWSCTFRGYQTVPWSGAFDHWESLPRHRLAPHLKAWIRRHLAGWTGCANFETIGGRIIEVHLRIGDLNQFQDARLFRWLHDACSAERSVAEGALRHLHDWRQPSIYLVPVFVPENKYDSVVQLSDKHVLEICDHPAITMVYRDLPPDEVGNPEGMVRLFNLTATNLDVALEIREALLERVVHHRAKQ